jgi:type IV pilus assembly protein PilB
MPPTATTVRAPSPRGTSGGMGLGGRLVAAGLISASQLEMAVREQKHGGGRLSAILIDLGFITADRISSFIAAEAKARLVDLKKAAVDKAALGLLPLEQARRFRAVPLNRNNGSLTVAMADPSNVTVIDLLHQLTGLHIDVVTASESDILLFIDQVESRGGTIQESIDRIVEEETEEKRPAALVAADPGAGEREDAPTVRLVSQILGRAVGMGASDIHFEPEEQLMRIRMRVDGLLHQDVLVPKLVQPLVTARMKILAEMDVAESRVPQDGRATVVVGQRQINLRVSSLPTSHGENIVVRILDPAAQILQLSSLGFTSAMEEQLRKLLDKPHGVIVVTGPTGSGKTTTLYAILHEICTVDLSIFTLEDPIEFRMAGIRQTQIKDEVGLTFGAGLRALLRQDPDVILVGETRDTETAQLMVRAALTGHLVFTTLHTNDAPGAIPRLIDMGVEPYLLPDSLVAVLAQRLVRRVCDQCREPVPHPDRVFERFGVEPPPDAPPRLWRGAGCAACKQTGYRGRQGVFELMVIEEPFHGPMARRAGAPEYYRLARAAGMQTMFDDGLRRAIQGGTTLEEVLRVTRTTPA